jgi:GDPmannose 4,6-dehydratase
LLLGDASKARRELGWKPKTDLKALVKEMIQADLAEVRKVLLLREHGVEVPLDQE